MLTINPLNTKQKTRKKISKKKKNKISKKKIKKLHPQKSRKNKQITSKYQPPVKKGTFKKSKKQYNNSDHSIIEYSDEDNENDEENMDEQNSSR